MKRVVILGAGTAGTIMANRLAKRYRGDLRSGEMTIIVVDQDNRHVYQPGLLFIPFRTYDRADTVKQRDRQIDEAVQYVQAAIDQVESDENRVVLAGDRTLAYDLLIVATGTRVVPEETEGLTGDGWLEKMFEFYTLDGAMALAGALDTWEGGRLVLNIVDLPIKCPIAPLEFVFLADDYFTRKGMRDKVSITLVTPLDGAFTRPLAASAFGNLLTEKGVELITEFATGSVDGPAGKLVSWDEREVDFDLLVSVPVHMGAEYVGRSPGLGDAMMFVLTDPATLQSQRAPNIFAIGDGTNLPTSKAGSVAHFEAEVLEENVARFLDGAPLKADFDGHANCFIETGRGKAVLIDFNYEVEPLPGAFPFALGPMPLLKESRINHWGKLAFKWVYWHALLPGHDIPGIPARMTMRGKRKGDLPKLERHGVQGGARPSSASTRGSSHVA